MHRSPTDLDDKKGIEMTGNRKSKGNHLGKRSQELLISEVELLLSEKRTSLSTLRTGIGLLPIPLSVFMVLIATSNYYNAETYLIALAAMSAFCVSLIVIGVYLIWNSMRHIHHIDTKIMRLRTKDQEVGSLIEDPSLMRR